MGVCAFDEGNPIVLVFDCISFGKHEIKTKDGLRLQSAIDVLARRIQIPSSKIDNVFYSYEILDKRRIIRDFNLPSGAVLTIKLKSN